MRLDEITRAELIGKSKTGLKYANSTKGNRWTAKSKCKAAPTVKDYNKIDMNTFWKNDELKFNIPVEGETDTYQVTVEFKNVLKLLSRAVKENDYKFDAKLVYDILQRAINDGNIKVYCSCSDFKYRFQYWATKDSYNAGKSQTVAANETNPKNQLGAACKHILCVLNNIEWLNKIASVIVNYANYCKDNFENNYGKFIFPKIYGMPYDKAIQMTFKDYDKDSKEKDDLDSDEATINLSNAIGKRRGQFKKGSNKNPASNNKK